MGANGPSSLLNWLHGLTLEPRRFTLGLAQLLFSFTTLHDLINTFPMMLVQMAFASVFNIIPAGLSWLC